MSSTEFSVGFSDREKLSSKVLKPPGGECSDIFGSFSSPSQQNGRRGQQQQQQASPIFGTEEPSPNNHNSSGRRDSDTQTRLFGGATEESSPRRVVDRMKSNIFVEQGHNNNASPTSNSKKHVRRNPITGEIYDDEEEENEVINHQNGNGDAGNPITGEGTPIQSNQATCVKIRNPPGGKSSGIF